MNNTLKQKFSKENLKPTTTKKKILLGVFILLLGALGLEATNNDYSLESLLAGESLSESKIIRDENGNINFDDPLTVSAYCESDTKNCADFDSQEQAQTIFEQCGGLGSDAHGLDGNNNGVACEALE